MIRRTLTVAVIATALALGAPLAANAVDYPGTLQGASRSVQPGEPYHYTSPKLGPQFVGGPTASSLEGDRAEQVEIVAASVRTGPSSSVDKNGFFRYTVTIPANASAGTKYTFSVVAHAATGPDVFRDSVTLTVAGMAADSASAAGALPFTGTNSTPFVWFGGGLLVLGAAFITMMTVVRRTRRNGGIA